MRLQAAAADLQQFAGLYKSCCFGSLLVGNFYLNFNTMPSGKDTHDGLREELDASCHSGKVLQNHLQNHLQLFKSIWS